MTLTTTGEATVTATVGARSGEAKVTVATRSGLTIGVPASITASVPAPFTFSVASGAAVQNVRVNWGDGQTQNLGAISGTQAATHTYTRGGSYVVTATAIMPDGTSEPSVTASVSVGEFSVSVTCSATNPSSCTATVSPTSTLVREFQWTVTKDGVQTQSRTTDGPSTQFHLASGVHTIHVTVVPVIGSPRTSSTTINVP